MNRKRYIIRVTALGMFLLFGRNTAYFCSLITGIKTFAEAATHFFVRHQTGYAHKELPLRCAPIEFPCQKKEDLNFAENSITKKNNLVIKHSPTPLSVHRDGQTKKILF